MKYALIKNNIVENIVELQTEEQVQNKAQSYQLVIQIDNINPQPKIGAIFNGSAFEGELELSMKITRLALQNRFTNEENFAIDDYIENVNAPYRKHVKLLYSKLSKATYIDLNRLDTIQGLQLLALAGIISPQRVTEILTTLPNTLEIYKE